MTLEDIYKLVMTRVPEIKPMTDEQAENLKKSASEMIPDMPKLGPLPTAPDWVMEYAKRRGLIPPPEK